MLQNIRICVDIYKERDMYIYIYIYIYNRVICLEYSIIQL